MNKEEILEDVKRHLDYVNATNQKSIRDTEMEVMYYEIDRLNNIINDKKERQDIAIRLLNKMFGTDDYEINYIIGIINGQRQIHFEELEELKEGGNK